jgi:hypothetical protein
MTSVDTREVTAITQRSFRLALYPALIRGSDETSRAYERVPTTLGDRTLSSALTDAWRKGRRLDEEEAEIEAAVEVKVDGAATPFGRPVESPKSQMRTVGKDPPDFSTVERGKEERGRKNPRCELALHDQRYS